MNFYFRMTRFVCFFVIGILSFVVSGQLLTFSVYATACDYVVGNSEEYTSIAQAVDIAQRSEVAGKTICVRDDKTYTERVVITKSGTADQPFTIKKHPDAATKPKIRDNTPFTADSFFVTTFMIKNANHVIVEDLEIERAAGIGMQVFNSNNVLLKNITAHHTLNSAIKLLNSQNSRIEGCTVYEGTLAESPQCLADPVCEAVPSKVAATVNMLATYNTAIENCVIFNSYGNALSSVKGEKTYIRNNTVYDNFRPLIHLDQAAYVWIENNLIYNTNNPTRPPVTSAFYKLDEYYDEQQDTPQGQFDFNTSTGRNRIIRNNIILNTETGIHYGPCEQSMPCSLQEDIIENNTVLDINEYALAIFPHEISNSNIVRQNIFDSQRTKGPGYNGVGTGISVGPNIWNKAPAATLANQQDLVATNPDAISQYFQDPTKIHNHAIIRPGAVDPRWFTVKPEYNQFGADASRVGASVSPPISPSPTPSPPSIKPGDTNGDATIDIFDYQRVLANFGLTNATRAQGDLTGNGSVDIFDYQQVLQYFGS